MADGAGEPQHSVVQIDSEPQHSVVQIDSEPQHSIVQITVGVSALMEQRLRSLDVDSIARDKPTIWKIPHDVRANNSRAYDPKLVAIGPYHHGKSVLQPMEDVKLMYLNDLLNRGKYNSVLNYATRIAEHEQEARRQYSERLDHLDSKGFVGILVLDGCFLVEFLLKRAEGKVGEPLRGQIRYSPNLRHDSRLLENQVPLFILQTILEESVYELPGSEEYTIVDLGLHYLYKGRVTKCMLEERYRGDDCRSIHHLLHLYYLGLFQGPRPGYGREPPADRLGYYLLEQVRHLISVMVHGLLFILRKFLSCVFIVLLYVVVSLVELVFLCKRPEWYASRKKPATKPRMIPTAMELKEAGVTFKRKENARYDLDVSFVDGTIEIPVVHVQENSYSEFQNLLALEQTCCQGVENSFTSFVVFMDNLVDTAADVAVLKRTGIIESKLGCDDDVARFFNTRRTGTCFDFSRQYLVVLFEEVNDYCNQEHNRWRAKLMHDYFGNPWAIFALIGVIVLLGLTAIQTAYTIKGAK